MDEKIILLECTINSKVKDKTFEKLEKFLKKIKIYHFFLMHILHTNLYIVVNINLI